MPTAAEILGVQNTPVDLAANPDSTAQIPLQDPGQTVDVNAPAPADVQTVDAQPGMIQPQPMDAYQDPEIRMAAAHHNWLGKIVDQAATLLGGDTSVHLSRTPDGTITVSHDPATGGEKWGRIASAVLGGALKGWAAGQGPGGAARAAATGFDVGQNVPRQHLAQANEQAKNMNEQQLAAANNALIHQKLINQVFANREAGMTLGTQEAGMMENAANSIADTPNAQDLGTFTDMAGVMKAVNTNPDILKGHTGTALKIIPTADAKGNLQFRAFLVDPGVDNRKNDKEEQDFYIDVDPKTGEPLLKSRAVAPQSQKNSVIWAAKQAKLAQFLDLHNKWRTTESAADKKETDPIPKSAQEAQAMADLATDPTRKQTLLNLVPKLQKLELEQKGRAAGGGAPSLGGASGPEALAALPTADAATVRAIGEGRQAPPSRFTKEGQRIMGMVNQVYPGYDATQYPTYQAMRKYMTSGAGGTGLNFIGTARNHLDELERTIPNNVNIPLIGSAINWAKNAATRSTSPELRAFESARNAVSSEVAKAYAGKAITQGEHDQMMSLINESDSPGALRGSIGEFRRLLNGKLSQYREQWNSAMPAGSVSPNSVIEGLLSDSNPAAAPTGGGAPAASPVAAPAARAAAPTPSFNATAWAAANPGKDVNAAIAKAQRQGLQVVR